MKEELLKFRDLLHIASWIMDSLRDLGFVLLKGIAWTVDSVSGMTKEVYKLIDFYNYKPIKEMIDTYQPIILAIGVIAVAYFGYRIMSIKKTDKNVFVESVILAMTILVLLPWGLQQGAGLVGAGTKLLTNERSASTEVFKNNITDLYTVDKNEWKSTDTQNDIDKKVDIELLNISEKVDTSNWLFNESPLSKKGKDLLTKQVVMVDGKPEIADMKSFWSIGDPAYYRYSWHPWLITLELFTKLIVYFFVMFKAARMINELGLLYLLTMGISLTDLKDGQRNKQLVLKIRDTFVVLYMVMFLINIFDLWSGFVAQADISSLAKGIAVAAGAWLVIDGPNFVEQLFGIDAGLSSVGRSVMAVTQGSIAGKGLAKTAGSMIKNTPKSAYRGARKIARTGAYVGGGMKGLIDGFKPSKNQATPTGTPDLSKKKVANTSNDNSQNNGSKSVNTQESSGNIGMNPTNLNQNSPLSKIHENEATRPAKPTKEMQKSLSKLKKPTAPIRNPKQQAMQNKKVLADLGVNPNTPLSNVNSASKARKVLEGKPILPPVPMVGEKQFPKHVQEASQEGRAAMVRDMQPRAIDRESVGDKVVGLYAQGAKRVLDSGTTARRTRKVYDVSKATSKRISDQFKD